MLTHIDLFSGVGGFALAAQWAGFRTEVFCEIDPFCREVLRGHWPNIPVILDVRNFDGTRFPGATLLTGGPPCQRTSVAAAIQGKRTGETLYPEMERIIRSARPTWVVIEQPPGNKRWENQVKISLEKIGYYFSRLKRSAMDIGAPHKRRRVFIIANTSCKRLHAISGIGKPYSPKENSWPAPPRGTWRATRTGNSRVDDGIPHWVDRVRVLGNAVVPQVAYEIIKEIARIEEATA